VHWAEILRRHPRHVALAALIAGLLCSGEKAWAVAIATALVPLAGFCTGRVRLALLIGVVVLAGAWIGTERREAIDRSQVDPFLGHAVVARGYVVRRERPLARAHRFRMRITALAAGQGPVRKLGDLVQVQARRDATLDALAIGQELEIRGVLSGLPDERQDGYAAYLRRAGVHGRLRADLVTPRGMRDGPVRALDELRRRAEAGVGAGLEPRLSALATGIVLGQDDRISAGMVEHFQDSGLAHLL
jgi:competence protein ComEC